MKAKGEPALDNILSDGTQEISEISREDILRQIFGDIGELLDDFTCAVESTVLLHGRMYITNKFICFYSNLFGLEKKIRIPYSHIRSITKQNTAVVIPNAIALSTDKKNYVFRSFWDREICFQTLTTFVEKIKNNQPIDRNSVPRASKRPSSTRSHTESSAPMVDGIAGSQNKHRSTPLRRQSNVSATAPSGSTKTDDTTSGGSSPAVGEGTVGGTVHSQHHDDDVEEFDTESGLRAQEGDGEAQDLDPAAQFQEEAAKARHKLPVVTGEVLYVSLREFEALFVSDNAPYSYKRYHEQVGDTNIQISEWTEMGSSLGAGREFKFFKPVNLPGLASTRGVKVQRYRRFEDAGLVMQSSTALEDVPAADTFRVEDTVAVRAIDAGSVSVDISFQVKFIKSTYMKYIIERSTNGEVQKWQEAYFKHLQKMCQMHKEGKLDVSLEPSPAAAAEVKKTPVPVVLEVPKPPANLAEGFISILSFRNETVGDQVKFFLCILLALYLVVNYVRWKVVNQKLERLESQLQDLERIANLLVSKLSE